ncbi:MAG: 3-dehydroquinate synthase [Cellulophaga sp.]|uniref:3-dehydroquinate synthase n=1 Tax=unclassified Cellulophaga TaxID=2634405 RepID=UPI0026E49251|nr:MULTISPECIES: 3-dehydroquinate synthase [unclassified Cellulophaga]MDO6491084.1 3-dehydroquinate synthase [Cellulophaga sp. 2_MG-2023]MDO6493722.1 3-dehydroquinate synthase [Cellulophaga sp. 3_MG-2023]
MQSILASTYSVHFNEKAYTELNSHLEKANYSKVFILVDENTHQHCLPSFMAQIYGDYNYEIIEIEEGEINKTIETCVQVWHVLSELDADRKSVMINLGGGVITDLGGFVASTFKRGIDFINVPTTLLSMVDASVGGKTGVDLGSLKNQVGVINQPQMVLVVSSFLQTLEERQLHSGFAEMLKHGLIKDKKYWNELNLVSDFNNLDEFIYDSVVIKNDVVTIDPTEQNLRKILNFGHTLGHAVESYFLETESKKTLLHGEAIAVGMILEAYISNKLTNLSEIELNAIKSTFTKRYGKVEFTEEDIKNILTYLKFDKKNSHGNINFVLLKSIGNCQIDVTVPEDLLHQSFAYYKV